MKTRIVSSVLLALAAAWSLAAAQPPGGDAKPGTPPATPPGPQDVVFLSRSGPLVIRFDIRADGKPLQAAWEDFVDYVFKYADTDGDGVLSRAEAEAAPDLSSLGNNLILFGGPGMPNAGGAKMDANNDGKVTKAEFAEYARKSGVPPFTLHAGPERLQGPRMGNPYQQTKPKTEDLNRALMKLLDTNGDGKLSRAELAAAPQAFRKLDLDEDEIITHQELLPGTGTLNVLFAVSVAMGSGPQKQPPDNTPVFLASPSQSPRDLARRLLHRYGGGEKGKKALTRADIGLDAQTFARLDRDGNGELDAEELARLLPRAPDLVLRVRLGERGLKEPAVELVGGKPAPGISVRTALDTIVFTVGKERLAVRVGASKPRSQLGAFLRQVVTAQFQAADRDNNGYIDEKEARMSGFGRIFKTLDRDGDGKVYEKDVLAYLDTIEGLQTRATAGCASVHFADAGRGLFDLFDADRDGRLSLREIHALPRLVDELDRDGDGAISEAEIPHSYLLRVEQGSGSNRGQDPFAALELLGVNNGPAPPLGKGPVWFQRMDRNRDGDVSRAEFLGSEALFRRIDTDRDGLISLEEAVRFEEGLRKAKEKR